MLLSLSAIAVGLVVPLIGSIESFAVTPAEIAGRAHASGASALQAAGTEVRQQSLRVVTLGAVALLFVVSVVANLFPEAGALVPRLSVRNTLLVLGGAMPASALVLLLLARMFYDWQMRRVTAALTRLPTY